MDVAHVEWNHDGLSVVVLHVHPLVSKELDVVIGD